VGHVITLGTPNRGSRFASLMAGASMAQMRPGNAWLAALPPRVADTPPFTALWSWHDSMVAPQSSCEMPGARNVALVGVGHNALLHDASVVARVVDELRRARAAEPLPA
jgi:triacylglycerol esterase/lipase EstA (alpha/beta hydrolase family)